MERAMDAVAQRQMKERLIKREWWRQYKDDYIPALCNM